MRLTPIALAVLSAGLSAQAQMQDNQERSLNCDRQESWRESRNIAHCEMREQPLPATGRIDVDGGPNGGVSVKGWTRNDILIRAQVRTNAPTAEEARRIAEQVFVGTSGGQIRSNGPQTDNNHNWSVTYEVFVPQRTDLNLKVHNGGVAIADVRGNVQFEAVNGGASLKRLAGTVRGRTVNGGLSIELTGDRWDGTEFDATTTNGGVSMSVPANYSARLETSTVNGHVNVDFPVTVAGKIGRELTLNLGNGGALVRATTTNGGVNIKRKG